MDTQNKANNIDLLLELIRVNFKMRYQNSFLGVFWVLIKPYITFAVMYFIWTSAGISRIDNYGLFLLIGVVMYTFINEMILTGQMALLERAHIILKVNFPRQIAVLSTLFSALINLGINLVLIFVILFFSGIQINIVELPALLLVIVILFAIALASSLFLSILTIQFRDLKNIMELFMFLFLWVTPIYYDIDTLGEDLQKYVRLNPFGVLFDQARAALNIYGKVDYGVLAIFLAISTTAVVLSWWYFSVKVKKIAEHF